ncbi:uncharacterized protein LOC119591332 [Penaeus monodon]|uniref:uncharacterized protein LOC119591332 n=1 Tax=Penaeus monodon TaxID=6687 RepID=UPI0018A73369|nr:uncharacterized protein LOC119591332 [Penaeus monodon]
MPVKVRSHIDERGLRTLAEVGSAADHFALTNPNYYCRSNEPSFPSNQHNSKRMEYSTRRTDLPDTHRTVNAKSSETGGESRNIASRGENLSFCRYCKKHGHVMNDCFKLANKRSDHNKRIFHVNANNKKEVASKYHGDKLDLGLSPFSMTESANVTPSFKPFCSTGFISADESCTSSSPVTILRDSAADISLVLKEAVPNPDCYTGDMQTLVLFYRSMVNYSVMYLVFAHCWNTMLRLGMLNQYAKLPIASMQRRGHSYRQRFNA